METREKECSAATQCLCEDVFPTENCERFKENNFCSPASVYFPQMSRECTKTCDLCLKSEYG